MKKLLLLSFRGVYALLNFSFLIVLAKVVGTRDYSDVVTFILILSYVTPLIAFGINPLVIKRMKSGKVNQNLRALRCWIYSFLSCLVVSAFLLLFGYENYYFVALISITNVTFYIFSELCRGEGSYFKSFLFSPGNPVSGSILIGIIPNVILFSYFLYIYMFGLKINSFNVLVVSFIVNSSFFIVLITLFRKGVGREIALFSTRWLSQYIKSGFNIFAIYLSFVFVLNLDLTLIVFYSGDDVVYDFSLASRIAIVILIIHTTLSGMYQSELNRGGSTSGYRLLSTSLTVMASLILTFSYPVIFEFLNVKIINQALFFKVLTIKVFAICIYVSFGFTAPTLMLKGAYEKVIVSCLMFLFIFTLSYYVMKLFTGAENSVLFSFLLAYTIYSICLYKFNKEMN